MYGELDDDINLVKIHITSGKVTLTGYGGFGNQAVPFLVERIKIKMADQDIDFFDYININKRPPLLNTGSYIDESFANYKKQVSFDKRLAKLFDINSNEDVLMGRENFNYQLSTMKKTVLKFEIRTNINLK